MRRLLRTVNLTGGLVLLLLLAAGCERSDRLTLSAETDDPQYRRGQQLLKQGHNQDALGAFLKVIEKRGDDAPESHLEAGLLYQQYFKDPISAIYHFNKYIELQPNSIWCASARTPRCANSRVRCRPSRWKTRQPGSN
jgi:tetratricopeptide (TPR) repeat protein